MLDASRFTVEVGDNGFQLIGPGMEESGVAEFGETAEILVGEDTYQCFMADHEDTPQVCCALAGEPKVEDVDFELTEGDEGGEEEEDEDEG